MTITGRRTINRHLHISPCRQRRRRRLRKWVKPQATSQRSSSGKGLRAALLTTKGLIAQLQSRVFSRIALIESSAEPLPSASTQKETPPKPGYGVSSEDLKKRQASDKKEVKKKGGVQTAAGAAAGLAAVAAMAAMSLGPVGWAVAAVLAVAAVGMAIASIFMGPPKPSPPPLGRVMTTFLMPLGGHWAIWGPGCCNPDNCWNHLYIDPSTGKWTVRNG